MCRAAPTGSPMSCRQSNVVTSRYHPTLGAELRAAVETGARCHYTPAGSQRWTIRWR